MKVRTFNDKDNGKIYLKVRCWKEPKEFWFDVWEKDETHGESPVSVTVTLTKRQVKSLIKFLQEQLEKWEKGDVR